jgi:hypothetical protein
VTLSVDARSYRRARERVNEPSGPPPSDAARRKNQIRSATSSSVGPNPNSSVSNSDGPVSSGFALTTTFSDCRSFDRASLFANSGISVENSVARVP